MKRRFGTDLNRSMLYSSLFPHRWRAYLLRREGYRVGDAVLIYGGLRLHGNQVLDIGDHVFINWDCYFDLSAPIVIGSQVRIADHVRLVTSTHAVGPGERRAGAGHAQAISIGDGAWLGAGCSVLPGVDVAAGCIIAAGAVVTATTTPNGLYAGVPARRVRDLP